MKKKKQLISNTEAKILHEESLVIDTQQPPATTGFIFTEAMKIELITMEKLGYSRSEAIQRLSKIAEDEIVNSESARNQYMSVWKKSGVNIASGTYSVGSAIENAFENSVEKISQAKQYIKALNGELNLILNSQDIEDTFKSKKRGLILDFQDTIPFGTNLDNINHFHQLGVRVVQLTYNLRNLVGDGCTERYQTGLSYFGKTVVERLNDLNMAIDVSHSSQQVGWDALEVSKSPIIITHSSSNQICYHDRGKDDDLAKAVADKGGFFGVVIVPGFIQNNGKIATLDDFARHVVHLVNVMGIDHVGIGSDICANGPETGVIFDSEFPETMPGQIQYFKQNPKEFNWGGFRENHRLTPEYRISGYDNFGDWPNLTVKLAEWGFNEIELKKILGLNYLRYFKEVVG